MALLSQHRVEIVLHLVYTDVYTVRFICSRSYHVSVVNDTHVTSHLYTTILHFIIATSIFVTVFWYRTAMFMVLLRY